MTLAFSFIGLRLNSPSVRVSSSEDTLAMVDSLEIRDGPDLAQSDDIARPTTAQTDRTARFSNFPSPAFQPSLPKILSGGAANSPEKQRKEQEEREDEAEDDGGDFGVHAAKVSKAGVAKILGAGVICGGGIAAMRESQSSLFLFGLGS